MVNVTLCNFSCDVPLAFDVSCQLRTVTPHLDPPGCWCFWKTNSALQSIPDDPCGEHNSPPSDRAALPSASSLVAIRQFSLGGRVES